MLAFLLPGKNLWPLNLGKNYFLLKIGLGKNYSFLGSIYTPAHQNDIVELQPYFI